MSILLLVRHAQASFFEENYDRLSSLGETQARKLGEYLAKREIVFDAAFTGPAERHKKTAALVGEQYRMAGVDWPEPEVLSEFHEHKGDEILKRSSEELAQRDDHLPELVAAYRAAKSRDEIQRGFQRLFEAVVGMWSEGEVDWPDVESWAKFDRRVRSGLERVTNHDAGGRKVIAFTSVGPVTIALHRALNGTTKQALELGWRLRNCSVTEFIYNREKFTLDKFNALPHLDDPDLITYR